jgi:NADH:ubiquinone oxidoreductase subunit 5 (subunit L)/multisubunit Na+/H+ antiporter MnhA subunit
VPLPLAATIALVQTDIKKVLFDGISIRVDVLALGLGAYEVAVSCNNTCFQNLFVP